MEALSDQPGWLAGMAVAPAAYLIGCVSTGYYLTRARTGNDIRVMGTGSSGARNVGRALGSMGFAVTLAGDLVKGGAAVWLAQAVTGREWTGLVALLAVTAGHVWPAQLGFHGGKGVATSLAALLMYDCWLTGVYLLLFGAGFSLTRRSVASSVVAYGLLPVASYFSKQDPAHVWGMAALAALIFVAHRQNIFRGLRRSLVMSGL